MLRKVELPLPRSVTPVAREPLLNCMREAIESARPSERAATAATEILAEDRGGAGVRDLHAKCSIERQHAGREVSENTLQIGPRVLHLRSVRIGSGTRLVELRRHAVERLGEHP